MTVARSRVDSNVGGVREFFEEWARLDERFAVGDDLLHAVDHQCSEPGEIVLAALRVGMPTSSRLREAPSTVARETPTRCSISRFSVTPFQRHRTTGYRERTVSSTSQLSSARIVAH